MPAAKKLIEVALPLDAINQASAREKSIRHGHPSTLHLWWARRPLAAARAVIFTSLVDDPADPNANPAFVAACDELPSGGANVTANGDSPRMRLFDFIEKLVTWEATTDEDIMEKARALIRIATNGNPPPLLDPFAGGGSIPLEAQRLGLEAHASDLNPVAVMINKAMIEIPPRFAGMAPVNPRDRATMFERRGDSVPIESRRGDSVNRPQWKGAAGLAADVRYYGEWMRERAFERIGHLYPKHEGETVIAWLWARTVISPNPAVNAPVPLVKSYVLSKKSGRECWAKPIIKGNTVRFEVTSGLPPKDEEGTIIPKHGAKCIISGAPIPLDYIRAEGKAGRMGAMLMAIVTQGKNGRNYHSATPEQQRTAESAEPAWRPVGALPEKHRSISTQLYGLDEYHKLFTARQLTALTSFSDLVGEAGQQVYDDALKAGLADDDVPLRDGGRGASAYGEAVSVYLAFAVDKLTARNSSLCMWDVGKSSIGQTFGRQALPMVWDYVEVNPISGAMGSWSGAIDRECRVIAKLPSAGTGSVLQQDAAHLRSGNILLSTDPPYYDNVGYSDLSDFFYVWMRRNLRDVYPTILGTVLVPKAQELVASRYRHGSKKEAKEFFESGMLETFSNIRRFVRGDLPLTVYYAFKQQDAGFMKNGGARAVASTGWETMLASLVEAGFSIVGTWPVRTEGGSRMNAQGTNALASSIVLVCRPRPEDAPTQSLRRFRDELRAKLPAAIAQMRTGKILPVDLAQASIGPGMAIYSRYRQVLKANGDPVTVRAALSLINAALAETLHEFVGEVDEYTRFAFDWFQEHQFEAGAAGRAETLATAKNTSLPGLERAGLIELGGGKVRLLHWEDYDPGAYDPRRDDRPTVWEGAHHLIERLNTHGETSAAMLLTKMSPELAGAAQDLAFSLYDICDRNGWARHARDYNGLIASWQGSDGIASEAARLVSEPEQPGLLPDLN